MSVWSVDDDQAAESSVPTMTLAIVTTPLSHRQEAPPRAIRGGSPDLSSLPPVYGTLGGMEKTTVYLSSEQKAALTEAARDQGRSEARLIRDGIDRVLARHRTAEASATLSGGPPPGLPQSDDRPGRPRWVSRESFVRQVVPAQADAALRAELRELAPDLTDDAPDR